jgi:predicted lipoprotein with Yx(FWY)xxD motif
MLAVSLTLAACGSSSNGTGSSSQSSSTPSTQSSSTPAGEGASAVVKTASNATLGATVLTNAQGMTLYALSGERAGKFTCASSACLQAWHPLSATAAGTPAGSVGSLGTVTRPDGSLQVSYKGMPLYTFTQDQAAGQAKGQGLKDVGTWNAVSVSAASAPATTSTESTQSTPAAPAAPAKSGGYGY